MSSARLADAVAFLMDQREEYRPHQVIVVRHGRRVLDVVFYPFHRGLRHDLASVGKAVTGMLIGIAIDQGLIASVDEPVLGFFPDRVIANRDARKEAMTIRHLLAQRSGIDHGGNSSAEWAQATASPDWVQWILDRPMAEVPGETWFYSNCNLHLAAAVLARATGMSPLEFAKRTLFKPLNIRDVAWATDGQGINDGSGDLQVHPLDLAKLSALYLNHGVWNGEQIVSSAWVETATSSTGPLPAGWPPEIAFGFHWEIRGDFFTAVGQNGQVVRYSPVHDLVMAIVAGGGPGYHGGENANLAEVLWPDNLVPAILADGPLPPDASGSAALASLVAQAPLPTDGPPQPVPPLPAVAATISGRRFVLDANPLGLLSLEFGFPGGSEASLVYRRQESDGSTSQADARVGLDGVLRFADGRLGLPVACKGWWSDSRSFVVLIDETALRNYFRVTARFVGSLLTATFEDLANVSNPALTVTGRMEP